MNITKIFAGLICIGYMACHTPKTTTASGATGNTETVKKDQYQCPMKCEGTKTYDTMGTCPKCKMDLVKLKK